MNSIHFRPTGTLREATELVAHGLVPVETLADLEKVAARYAVAVTPDIAALIDPDDPNDPIARQFIPSAEELVASPGENADPIGDQAHSPVSGIVHRYPDRVLFKLVQVCAVYCRFCFRREMVGPGKANALSTGAYDNALNYIRAHSQIWEVILTGGDPLMLSPRRLAEVMADLAAIDHVRIIRIHTRVPVADPARISAEMIAALRVKGAATWVALHANHPRELSDSARAACAGIIDAGACGARAVAQFPGVIGVQGNPGRRAFDLQRGDHRAADARGIGYRHPGMNPDDPDVIDRREIRHDLG